MKVCLVGSIPMKKREDASELPHRENRFHKKSAKKKNRITLADVGQHCGYHGTTVGMALRNHPAIPDETRRKIQESAKALGYIPDPALRALAAHRYGLKDTHGYTTIAVISDHQPTDGWRKPNDEGARYFKGMKARASELGYTLEEFNVGKNHELQNRLDEILKARGICSVIVAPQVSLDLPVNLDWKAYCAVAIGYSLVSPPLPRVTHHHRDGAQTAVKELIELGYRKIAFINPYAYEVRVGFDYCSGFFTIVNLNNHILDSAFLIPRNKTNLARPETLDWIKANRPEVVITSQAHLLSYFRENNIKIPEDMGFVRLGVPRADNPADQISGIEENSVVIGNEAVELVSSMQLSHSRGIPAVRQVHLVQGKWIEGTTIRRM